jgi:hypothetical protein
MYMRRLSGDPGPWTTDPILKAHRFTNTYRASDRVSQYLIANVQYGAERSQAPDEVFFRTILFKLFNRIETWERIERELGPVSWQAANPGRVTRVLDEAFMRGSRLYSAAYIMPAPAFGAARKHANHVALLWKMMEDGLPARVRQTTSLDEVYKLLLSFPGLGRFLAFQFAIDLNYSSLLQHDEADYVVAGPGAVDGISKCFDNDGGQSPEQVIHWVTARQDEEFARRGIDFPGLFGRRLQPIDCQNLFCEISKYARSAHPEYAGVSGRTRIKQGYRMSTKPLPDPFFPPRWGISVPQREPSKVHELLL